MQRELIAQTSEGSFQAHRENDILSTALGNKEHPGRTRGKGVSVPWIHGFADDYYMYRRRKRSKAEYDDGLELLKQEFQGEIASLRDQMNQVLRNQSQAAPVIAGTSPPRHRSSVASTHNFELDDDQLPIDGIKVMYIYGMHQR